MRETVTAACVQVEPAILDRAGTLERVAERTAEAAAAGAGGGLVPSPSQTSLRPFAFNLSSTVITS